MTIIIDVVLAHLLLSMLYLMLFIHVRLEAELWQNSFVFQHTRHNCLA